MREIEIIDDARADAHAAGHAPAGLARRHPGVEDDEGRSPGAGLQGIAAGVLAGVVIWLVILLLILL